MTESFAGNIVFKASLVDLQKNFMGYFTNVAQEVSKEILEKISRSCIVVVGSSKKMQKQKDKTKISI